MAMTATLLSKDETIYPSANEWRPERFIDDPFLDKMSLSFSKGTRLCLGVSMMTHRTHFMPHLLIAPKTDKSCICRALYYSCRDI